MLLHTSMSAVWKDITVKNKLTKEKNEYMVKMDDGKAISVKNTQQQLLKTLMNNDMLKFKDMSIEIGGGKKNIDGWWLQHAFNGWIHNYSTSKPGMVANLLGTPELVQMSMNKNYYSEEMKEFMDKWMKNIQ